MSQKRNKIIFWIGVVFALCLLILGIKFHRTKTQQFSFSPEQAYKKCRFYLREPQSLGNGNKAVLPKAICKIVKGEVKLMPIDDPDIRPGDVVIEIIDAQKFFTEEYFRSKHLVLTSREKVAFNQGKVRFCVSYGPYDEKSPLTLLPDIFQSPKILNKTAITCQEISLKYLSPIGVIGRIPSDSSGKPFGLSILIPHNYSDIYNTTYTTLFSSFIRVK